MPMQQILSSQASPEIIINENFESLDHLAVYARNPATTSALTWGYYGGRWAGFAVSNATLALTASSTNYIVVNKTTGVISTSTATTNWNNSNGFARVYSVVTGTTSATSYEDHRVGGQGIFATPISSGTVTAIPIAVSDETTALTIGTAKVTFRMPFAMTLTAVRASVTTAPTGSVLTVDINEAGNTILSTKLTIDATEKTSTTAATVAVISDTALADDAEMTIDIDTVGSTIAGAGLKVYLIGTI